MDISEQQNVRAMNVQFSRLTLSLQGTLVNNQRETYSQKRIALQISEQFCRKPEHAKSQTHKPPPNASIIELLNDFCNANYSYAALT